MTQSSMKPVEFVLATAEDYDELMAMSGGIYKGMDYLPSQYHAWLKDHRRHVFLAKNEGKIVAFESFLLVDGGETAVVEGLRVAPWMRGQGVAGLIQKFCFDTLNSDHPGVKRVRLMRAENPPPNMLKKYKVIHTKAVLSKVLPSNHLQEAIKSMEARLDNVGELNNFSVLELSEVLTLIDGTKTSEELLPHGLLIQNWLPLTTQRSNLEMLFERGVVWIYSQSNNTHASMESSDYNTTGSANKNKPNNVNRDTAHNTEDSNALSPPSPRAPAGFLSLGTPPLLVPYAEATYRFDVDLFGVDPASAKIHVVQQLKRCTNVLPAEASIVCFMYAEESLRSHLNHLCEELAPYIVVKEQMVLEMDIKEHFSEMFTVSSN
ncbi:probable N-acetyltransferase 16 [Hyperolius riggenbachi]|uniref:probable N-acetyltransferase 16 n=1 Tax=Hyperolius riggenbachi TaxID=752182 RepID=UPI0035A3A4DB